MTQTLDFFATAARGLEPLLAEELRALGADAVRETRGGAEFRGPLETAYRACLWSRVGSRVLLPLARFSAPDPDRLYEGVGALPWEDHLAADGTLAVDFVASRSGITHSRYGALRVKDAVVDRFRARLGVRPSVDTRRPSVRINVYLHRDEAQVALDLSGEALHRRGYRAAGAGAPLKETLAAAILLRAGWPSIAAAGGPFLDPMCGSGTLPIEAAMMAADIAPGLDRNYYGFFGWRGHDDALWKSLIDEALDRREQGLARIPDIRGYDHDADAVRIAIDNVRRADLTGHVHIERRALSAAAPLADKPGLFAVNPPYGERLGDAAALVPLYAQLGDLLKTRFAGWNAAVFTAAGESSLQVGLKPRKAYQLYNGALECRLALFDIAQQAAPEALSGGAEMFANRLRKNQKQLARWIARESISNYRLYDADLPEYNLAVDVYQGERLWAHVQEYQAPRHVDPRKAGRRVREALRALGEVLEIPPEQIFFKVRRRQKGTEQYQKLGEQRRFHEVREGTARLLVNFTDYLDTGLFLDHRPTRARIHALAEGKRFLNLFCYTAAATVQAGLGGARLSTSVDLSRTYLDWAARNLRLNGLRERDHELVQTDCLAWLAEQAQSRRPPTYDLIFLDPPTFSTSKRMQRNLDIQRDHAELLDWASRLLAPQGLLLFSNNLRSFKLDREALSHLDVRDITPSTIPPDFARNPKIHHCFEIRRRGE